MNFAILFRGRGLVEARMQAQLSDGFQESDTANARYLASVLWHVKRNPYMALSSQVVDLVWGNMQQKSCQVARIGQITVVQF